MSRSTFSNSISVIRACLLATILISLGTVALRDRAEASTTSLRVIVTRENNSPISGASVCIAPATGAAKSAFTDLIGQANFDAVESGQVTITVSCSGFTGQSHTSTLTSAGGSARFILSSGSGGPACSASAPPPSKTPATVAITSFDWHLNRRTPLFFEAVLSIGASATPGGPFVPTQYRVGESSDLNSLPWIDYPSVGVITHRLGYVGNTLTAYGQRTLFVQVRQNSLISPIVSKSVTLQPLSTTEFRFDASNLSQLLDAMSANGFRINTTSVSATQNRCPGISQRGLEFSIPNGYISDRAWEKIVVVSIDESSQKRFTNGWRVKSIDIGDSTQVDPSVARSIAGQSSGDGFRVVIHMSVGPKEGRDDLCLDNAFPLRGILLEGPADDMALDQAKRWKNMFPAN